MDLQSLQYLLSGPLPEVRDKSQASCFSCTFTICNLTICTGLKHTNKKPNASQLLDWVQMKTGWLVPTHKWSQLWWTHTKMRDTVIYRWFKGYFSRVILSMFDFFSPRAQSAVPNTMHTQVHWLLNKHLLSYLSRPSTALNSNVLKELF